MSAVDQTNNDAGFSASLKDAASATAGGARSDETALRHQARQAIASGRLPRSRPAGVWGGPGSGTDCDICGKPVAKDGLGFELEFRAGAADPPQLHQVHIRCFAAWEFECQSF